MPTVINDDRMLASPFYRVTVKAIILDDQQHLLVIQNKEGLYEMPGGGWEHGEDLLECLQREVMEEVGQELLETDGTIAFTYSALAKRGYRTLRLAIRARLANTDPSTYTMDETMESAHFVTKDEFLALGFAPDEQGITGHANDIWSAA